MDNKADHIINELKGKQSLQNFVILLFIVLLLAIDFLPYFKSLEIINPQFLYLAVLNLITGIYLYFNSNLISNQILPILRKSYVFIIYWTFLFFCGITFFWAKNTSLVLTKFTEIAIVFCLFINLSILLKNKLDLFYKIVFIICIGAFIQSWQQIYNFIIIPRNASIIQLLGVMKGNTGNINILAASLTIKVPFLLVGINQFTFYKKWFTIIALFSVTAVIFLTGARTPLISLFLIFTVYSIYIIRENSFTRSSFSKIIYFVVPVLIAVLFSNSIFEKSKDKGRYVSLSNKVDNFNGEDSSSQLRLAYWENAIKISEKNPVFGIGLGNYQVESIPYEKTVADNFIVSLHAHNDFLEITAETGVLNGLVYLSLFLFIAFINLKRILKSKDYNTRMISVLILMLVIVYGVDSCLNFPMYRPTMQIFFTLMLAFSVVNNSEKIEFVSQNKTAIKIVCSVLIITGIVTSYSAYLIFKASHLEFLIAGDNINLNKKGSLTGDEVVALIPKYPNVLSSSEAYYEYAGIYYIREKNYEKAFKCFSKASKINPYSGRIDFYKQLIAASRGKIDSAYIYSKQAYNLRPRNYDLYKNVTRYSIIKKDTVELLKNHALFSKYNNVPETWVTAVNALQSSGANHKRLLSFVNQGLRKMPKDSTLVKKKNELLITTYLVDGQNFENRSELNNALKSYEKALKIDPKNIYILQNIGFNYLKEGQNKKAISTLLDALKYPGLNDGKTEFFLGISYLRENYKTNALKYFTISKDKNFLPAKELLSRINNSTISEQSALQKRKNDLLIADYITEGQKFEEQKKLTEALLSYEKALKIDPKSIYAAQNIGFYYLKIGQSKKAIGYLLNALKYPGLNDGKTEYFLAICYLQERDKNSACKYLNVSKSKNYSDADQLVKNVCK